MFQSPSKLKINKLLKGRTLSFETVNKTHGNMVIIPTLSKTAMTNTIKSSLFRPMQLLALYTPRRIKPIGRSMTLINQKEYYADIRQSTNGRIRKGKTLISAYNGQNLVYDIYNDYLINTDALSAKKQSIALQKAAINFFQDKIEDITDDPEYSDCFLVFPMERGFENGTRIFRSANDRTTLDPLALFVSSIIHGDIDLDKYKRIKRVLFYIPKGDILLVADLNDPQFLNKIWPSIQQKLIRMNNYVLGKDDLADEVEDEEHADITPEEKLENKKEEIKQVVLKKVAKTIHATNNLDDFEAASRDERDLMVSIDKKVEKYLDKKENLQKTVVDMADEIEEDDEVKLKAIKYVETKKASILRSESMAKGLEKEAEIIGNLQDIEDDDTTNDADEFKVDVPDIDKRIEKSRLSSIDDQYNKKQQIKDITNVISAFSNTEYSPMVVDSLNIEDSSNSENEKSTYNVRYKTDDGKTLSFQLDVPKIVDKRFLYLNGNKKVIKKQLMRLPIVKTKPDRVEITTNVNKMTIERTNGKLSRKNMYLLKKLKEIEKNPLVSIEYGNNSIVNSKLGYSNDFEYEELASYITKITTVKYQLIFNRDEIREDLDLQDIDDSFIDNRTPLGFEYLGTEISAFIFIENEKIYSFNFKTKEIKEISSSIFDFIADTVLKLDMSIVPSIGKSFVYTTVKFLRENYPLFILVASQKGITNILDRYGVKYYKTTKAEKNINYIEIKFKDCYLYYEDTIKNTLLLNSIYLMDTEDYNYSDFDIDIPYTRYFMKVSGDSLGIHVRNTLRINLSVFIDPITHDILRDLKQPTNIIDLILYANTLLISNQYKTQNDITNYRVRGNEVVAAVMYKKIADSYTSYCKHRINGKPANLNLSKKSLITELLTQPNINDKTTLNPILELEQVAQASAKGFRGVNLNDAYTLEMRSYDDSMLGVLSGNGTPYSAQAGITRALSYDPRINSIRGYIPYNDDETLSATNVLSPTELLSSFTSSKADPPRQAMQIAQTGHTIPVMKASKQLIGSGMNKTLAFLISDDFAFKAKQDGFVEKIDMKNKIAVLQYKDGTKDAIDLDDKLDKNSGMGYYIHQVFKMVYAEGEKFEQGDVLAYNPAFFTGKGKNIDYLPGTLAKIAVASADFAFEDSTLISESLVDKCASKINKLKQCVLGKNTEIHSIVKVGDKIETGDPLIEYTESFEDEDAAELLQKLTDNLTDEEKKELTNSKIPAKVGGTVTKMEVYYNCPFEELSPSLQKIVKAYKTQLESRSNAVAAIHTNSVHVPPLTQTTSTNKIKKEEFPDGGGVIINIYVEYIDKIGKGDKLVYYTALKGVVSNVTKKEESPISDYRPDEPIEGILAATGILSRMTADLYSALFGNKVLVELGKQIREIWKK